VSIDTIVDANNKYSAYWARIKAEFEERKYLDKEYATMPMKRSQKSNVNTLGHHTRRFDQPCPVAAVRKERGGGGSCQGVMRHGVDYEKHRPVVNPKRKV
jgi:hypothetical protein